MLGAPWTNPSAKNQGTSMGNHLTCSSTRERPTGRLVQCFGIANVWDDNNVDVDEDCGDEDTIWYNIYLDSVYQYIIAGVFLEVPPKSSESLDHFSLDTCGDLGSPGARRDTRRRSGTTGVTAFWAQRWDGCRLPWWPRRMLGFFWPNFWGFRHET